MAAAAAVQGGTKGACRGSVDWVGPAVAAAACPCAAAADGAANGTLVKKKEFVMLYNRTAKCGLLLRWHFNFIPNALFKLIQQSPIGTLFTVLNIPLVMWCIQSL